MTGLKPTMHDFGLDNKESTRRLWPLPTGTYFTCLQHRRSLFARVDFGLWHECDIARSWIDVRFRGKSGRAADITGTTGFDPNVWSGRALQGDFFELADVRSCINVSGL